MSGHADVVAVMSAREDRFPAVSYASTPTWYAVPHTRLVKVAAVWPVVPTRLEPRYSPYPATPTLSVEADHDMFRLVAAAVTTRRVLGVDGATVSPDWAHGCVDADTVATAERLPATSTASAPS